MSKTPPESEEPLIVAYASAVAEGSTATPPGVGAVFWGLGG